MVDDVIRPSQNGMESSLRHVGGRELQPRLHEHHSQPCPQCGARKHYKSGRRILKDGSVVQRYLCRSCNHRFSDPDVKVNVTGQQIEMFQSVPDHFQQKIVAGKFATQETLNPGSFNISEYSGVHKVTNRGKTISIFPPQYSSSRVCDSARSKNLETATETKTVAGEHANTKGKILQYLWYLNKEGRKPLTLIARRKALQQLADHGANLDDPETVKEVIANRKVSVNTKLHYVTAYDGFAQYFQIQWKPPKYKAERKIPWLPTEAELDQLTAGYKKKTAVFLTIAKETMARAGEIWALKWTDINVNILTINDPEKGSLPRQFKISDKLQAMINSLPRKHERIFGPTTSLANFRTSFIRKRKHISYTLSNPRLNKITFHTFRHWGATMLYAKTKDILLVQQKLGHRCIENTMVYTQLINFESDEWHVAHAKTLIEEDNLISNGFEFVRYNQNENLAIYRKRK